MGAGPALWWDITKVLLFLGALALVGKYLPVVVARYGDNSQVGRQRRMQLVETLRLGPEQAVHLVEVNGVQLVLGSSKGGVNLLTQVAEGVETAPAKVEKDRKGTTQRLRRHA